MDVYVIENMLDNKKYVGITSLGALKRFEQHVYDASKGSNYLLHKAIRKHGLSVFKLTIIEVCDTWKHACDAEIRVIAELKTHGPNGYNLTDGGDGVIGHKHSEETKNLIRTALQGKFVSNETRKKIGDKHRGKILSDETRKKISIKQKGKTSFYCRTQEIRTKISKNQPHKRCVEQFTKAGELIAVYESLHAAGRATNLAYQNIHHCCKGRILSTGGYRWRFKDGA